MNKLYLKPLFDELKNLDGELAHDIAFMRQNAIDGKETSLEQLKQYSDILHNYEIRRKTSKIDNKLTELLKGVNTIKTIMIVYFVLTIAGFIYYLFFK